MTDGNPMAVALATALEMLAPMREAALGYRQSLIDAGMEADAASRCAADFHHFVLMQVLASMGRHPK